MSENRILSEISQHPRIDTRFHNLNKDQRRRVLEQVSDFNEKEILKVIRKVKRNG